MVRSPDLRAARRDLAALAVAAEWVRTADDFTWLSYAGIVAGIRIGMSNRRAVILGGLLGAVAIVITTAGRGRSSR